MVEAQIPHGYKQTEVGVIPEDWDTRSCSALSDLITVGIVIRPTQYYTKQGVPALRSANIREDRIDDADMVFISEKANALLSKSQVRMGDVLTVRTGYPGTSAVVPPSFAGTNCIDILITRPSKAVSSKYLSAWINSPFGKHQVLRNQGGLAQQHFNVSDLRNLVVALPPLAEQEALAEALSDADAFIESLEQLIAKKCQIKQGALQELLTGKKRLPRFETQPGYKQTEVGVIPKEWEVRPLVDIAEIRSGIAKNSNIAVSNPVLVHYLRVANVQDGFLDLSEMSKIRMNINDIKRYAVLPGDVLMNEGGDLDKLGRGSMWRGEFSPCVHQNHVFVVRCGSRLSPDYLNVWTGATPARRYFMLAGKQTTNLASINKTALGQLPVTLPPRAEQEALATILSDMDAEIAALEKKLAKAHQLKQGMMQELLTGRIRLV
jgi:type I restriction enzyme, S subunit